MPDNNNGSANAGSPIGSAPNANSFGTPNGVGAQNHGVQIDPEQYKNLEGLVGRQGQEIGEYRKYFEEIAPLLERLDKNPDIVHAILDGKLTGDLAKAAMDGKLKVEDAQIVNKAHIEVKKELGTKAYQQASPEDIEKMINDKVAVAKGEFDQKLKENDDIRAFEENVNDFIAKTPDFAQYAETIDKWIDEHDVTDIAVAYYAVKGELSEKEAIKKAEEDQGEFQKMQAANATGGYGQRTTKIQDQNVIDNLISSKSNPNIL